jgi:hypothetical protein
MRVIAFPLWPSRIGTAAAALVVLASGAALADGSPEQEALRLLDAGVAAFNRGDLEEALADTRRAHELVPDRANPYRWLGVVETALGRCDEARRDLDEFIARAPEDDTRRTEARRLRDACVPAESVTTGALTIDSDPPGAEVRLGSGPLVGVTPLRREGLPPGPLEVSLRSPGFAPEVREVVIIAGREARVSAPLRALLDNHERQPSPRPAPRHSRLLLGIAGATAAIGVGLLASGIYFGVHGAQLSDDVSHPSMWTPQLDQTVRVDGPATNRDLEITVAIGSVAVATAAVLTVVALRRDRSTMRAAATPGSWSF